MAIRSKFQTRALAILHPGAFLGGALMVLGGCEGGGAGSMDADSSGGSTGSTAEASDGTGTEELDGTTGSGSSDGSDGPTGAAPLIDVVFPPPGALAVRRQLTVRGTASDDQSIASVEVDGVSATSDDDFATWQAVVTLSGGSSSLVATVVDSQGSETSVELPVEHRPLVHGSTDLVWDDSEAFIVDGRTNAVLTLDVETGVVQTLSDETSPAEDPLEAPVAAAFIADSSDLLVVDANTLQRVDKTTGQRTTLASSEGAIGFSAPVGLVVENGFGRALIVDEATGDVVAVDLDSGNKSVISSNVDGAYLGSVGAVTYRSVGWSLYVVNDGDDGDRVVEIDTSNGSRSVLDLDQSLSMPGFAESIGGAAVDGFGDRLFVGGLLYLYAVDLNTGEVEPISQSLSSFTFDRWVTGLAWSSDQQRLLGLDWGGTVFSAEEADSWERAYLSGAHHPTLDPPLNFVGSMAGDGERLFVPACDFDWTGFIEIDLATGQRIIHEDWPDYCGATSMCGDEICLSHTDDRQLVTIDPQTGASTPVTSIEIEAGWGDAHAYDPSRNALMFGDTSTLIERVDLATGDREIFSEEFDSPCALTVDEARDDLLLIDDNQLWRVPLAGGPRESIHTFEPSLGCSLTSNIVAAMPDADTLWVPNEGDHTFHIVDLTRGTARLLPFDERVGWMSSQVRSVPGREWMLASVIYPAGLVAVDPQTGEAVTFSR